MWIFVLAEANFELLDTAILLFEAVFELLNVVVFSGELVAEGIVFSFEVSDALEQRIVR